MAKKPDLKQIDQIAQEYDMILEQRRAFGNFLEEMKQQGEKGTKNEKGDFTYQELREKANEFLGLI